MVAKILATLPPRLAASLKYNRCLNVNGGEGRNIACDQALEFLNKKCKESLAHCNVVTEKVLKRVGHSIAPLKSIEESVEQEIAFYSSTGRREHPSYSEVSSIATDLFKYNLFSNIPGRSHEAFPAFKENKTSTTNGKLNNWITRRKELLANEERMRYIRQ